MFAMKIYKYHLKLKGYTKIEMGRGAVTLAIQTQRNIPCLWAQFPIGLDVKGESRYFRTILTGETVNDFGLKKYIGTFKLDNGSYVGHVFEVDKDIAEKEIEAEIRDLFPDRARREEKGG